MLRWASLLQLATTSTGIRVDGYSHPWYSRVPALQRGLFNTYLFQQFRSFIACLTLLQECLKYQPKDEARA